MTMFQISGFILICCMIRMVYLATRYVSGARYKQWGVYHITINAWFRGNDEYKEWLRNNKTYHWCVLLIMSLCLVILTLIDSYRRNELFIMFESSTLINVLLCISILKAQFWFVKRLGK